MSRMKSESHRWTRDEDDWLKRPLLARDVLIPRTADSYMHIGSGFHSFIEDGHLYCRNAKQRRRLDLGLPV